LLLRIFNAKKCKGFFLQMNKDIKLILKYTL